MIHEISKEFEDRERRSRRSWKNSILGQRPTSAELNIQSKCKYSTVNILWKFDSSTNIVWLSSRT